MTARDCNLEQMPLFAFVKVVLQFVGSGRSIPFKRRAAELFVLQVRYVEKWNKEARYNGQFSHHSLLHLLNHIERTKEKRVEFLHKCKGSPHCFLKVISSFVGATT